MTLKLYQYGIHSFIHLLIQGNLVALRYVPTTVLATGKRIIQTELAPTVCFTVGKCQAI